MGVPKYKNKNDWNKRKNKEFATISRYFNTPLSNWWTTGQNKSVVLRQHCHNQLDMFIEQSSQLQQNTHSVHINIYPNKLYSGSSYKPQYIKQGCNSSEHDFNNYGIKC